MFQEFKTLRTFDPVIYFLLETKSLKSIRNLHKKCHQNIDSMALFLKF
jgi:hypothetical protein